MFLNRIKRIHFVILTSFMIFGIQSYGPVFASEADHFTDLPREKFGLHSGFNRYTVKSGQYQHLFKSRYRGQNQYHIEVSYIYSYMGVFGELDQIELSGELTLFTDGRPIKCYLDQVPLEIYGAHESVRCVNTDLYLSLYISEASPVSFETGKEPIKYLSVITEVTDILSIHVHAYQNRNKIDDFQIPIAGNFEREGAHPLSEMH